jgi:hypothetical protein
MLSYSKTKEREKKRETFRFQISDWSDLIGALDFEIGASRIFLRHNMNIFKK